MGNTYFMRHGDTFTNADKSLTVAQASKKLALSELGKEQCRKVVLPKDLDLVIISDSRRTKESAKIVLKANHMSIPIKVEKDLYPWNSGSNDWNTYWARFYDFVENYDPWGPYENKISMTARVDSVLRKYSNKNILVIAHSILLSTYLGRDGLNCAELIRVN